MDAMGRAQMDAMGRAQMDAMKRIVLWTLVLMVLAGFTGWYVQSYRDAAEITPVERLTPLAEAGDAAAQ